MVAPNTTNRFIIQLGNGGTPTETFAFTCGANSFEVNLTNNTGEQALMDCTTPLDLPASISRWVESQDTSATIGGRIAKSSLATWLDWADGMTVKNVKMFFDESGANNGGYWIVPMLLTQFQISKSGSATVEFTASMQATGPRVWTDAA